MKKYILFLFIFFVFNIICYAQNNSIDNILSKGTYTDGWVQYIKTDNLEISFQYTTCPGTIDCCEMLFFKVKNSSDSPVSVSWVYELGWEAVNGGPVTSTEKRTICYKLNPQEEKSGNCNQSESSLIFFVRELSSPDLNVLSHVDITELTEEN